MSDDVRNRETRGVDGPMPAEESVVLSDLHLSEGAHHEVSHEFSFARRVWERWKSLIVGNEPHPCRHVANPLEDFPDDDIFVRFLNRLRSRTAGVPIVRLRLLGDILDPLAVTWNGDFDDPPFEEVAVEKMRRIMSGHPRFFGALSEFLKDPRHHVDFFVGNHDLFLAWPAVQSLLRDRLTAGDASVGARLRIIDQSMRFEEVRLGVLYKHGNDAEPHEWVEPDDVIVTKRLGLPLKRPILNMPYGSYAYVGVVNRIKLHNPLVGRLTTVRDLIVNAALHRWGWTFYMVLSIVGNYLFHYLFAFWDIRNKVSLAGSYQAFTEASSGETVDRHVKKLLKERDDIKAVITGHTHEWRRMSGPDGTYLNTGSWADHYDLEHQQFRPHWRLPFLEMAWRATQRFFDLREPGFAGQIIAMLGWLTAAVALAAFVSLNFPLSRDSLWTIRLSDFQVPALIVLLYLFLTAFIRLMAVKPVAVRHRRCTFADVRHYADGSLQMDLLEYRPDKDDVIEPV